MSSFGSWIQGIGQAATAVSSVRAVMQKPAKSRKPPAAPDEGKLRTQRRRELAKRQLSSGRSSTLLSDKAETFGSGY